MFPCRIYVHAVENISSTFLIQIAPVAVQRIFEGIGYIYMGVSLLDDDKLFVCMRGSLGPLLSSTSNYISKSTDFVTCV